MQFLTQLYAFQDAVVFISKYYFDGHQILFPDVDRCLADLIKDIQEQVEMFNDSCIEETEQEYRIDLKEVRKGAGQKTIEQTALLVDMAKSEALDCLGDQQAARVIAERYLS